MIQKRDTQIIATAVLAQSCRNQCYCEKIMEWMQTTYSSSQCNHNRNIDKCDQASGKYMQKST